MKSEEAIFFFLRFTSVAIFSISGYSAFGYYYVVEADKQSFLESFLGYNCTAPTLTTNSSSSKNSSSSNGTDVVVEDAHTVEHDLAEVPESVCAGPFYTRFSLYDIHADSFIFTHNDLCGTDVQQNAVLGLTATATATSSSTTSSSNTSSSSSVGGDNFNTDLYGLLGGNFGDCEQLTLYGTLLVAIGSWCGAMIALFWLTVYTTHTTTPTTSTTRESSSTEKQQYLHSLRIYFRWLLVVAICAALTLITYAVAINPSRSSASSSAASYCHDNPAKFAYCLQRPGPALYTQIVNCVVSTLLVAGGMLYIYTEKQKQQQQKQVNSDNIDDDDGKNDDDDNNAAVNIDVANADHEVVHRAAENTDDILQEENDDAASSTAGSISETRISNHDIKSTTENDQETLVAKTRKRTTVKFEEPSNLDPKKNSPNRDETIPDGTHTADDTVHEDRLQRMKNACTNLHFWIKFGRMAEFCIMIVSLFLSYTNLYLTDQYGRELDTSILLWDDTFCTETIFWLNLFGFNRHENGHIIMDASGGADDGSNSTDAAASPLTHTTATFGFCSGREMFHVHFLFLKVVISSGLALVLKRDAKQNPMFYLIGILMDFLSIIFLLASISVFYLHVYPGRPEVQPPYCSVWMDYNRNGEDDMDDSPSQNSPCRITLGAGFWLSCLVLVLACINFLGEFIIAETVTARRHGNDDGDQSNNNFDTENAAYGARNAYNTVFGRVREGRFKSALIKPASCFHLDVDGV